MYEPTKWNRRTFTIVLGPHVADPAYLLPMWEKDGDGGLVAEYSDFSELKTLIANLERKAQQDLGYSRAEDHIYSKLGIKSPFELDALAERLKKERNE